MDLNAYIEQHAALYGHHIKMGTYPEDALIGVNTDRNRAGWKAPLNDPEKIHAIVGRLMKQDPDYNIGLHFRVNPLRNREYTYREAGAKADALAWPALVMDWDTADGKHAPFTGDFAGYRHPERHEIEAMIMEIMPDTLRVNTGGGFQSIFATQQGLATDDATNTEFLQQVQQRWADAARERGFGIDMAVGVKPTQTLRIAGSLNTKRGHLPVEIVRHDPAVRYDILELDRIMPALRRKPRPERTTNITNLGSFVSGTAKGKAFAWNFAKTVPASWLLEGVWGMAVKEGTEGDEFVRYIFPRDDGSLSSTDSHVAVKTGETGIERAYAMSSRVQGEFGVEDASTGLTSWDLLLIILSGKTLMAEMLTKTHKKPTEDLLETLREINEVRHARAAA